MKLSMEPGPVAASFIEAVATGAGDEILALGPRGEAKTTAALLAMPVHAKFHEEKGFITGDEGEKIPLRLPVPWMGVTDTFNSHKEKTIPSAMALHWQGGWRSEDGGHKLIFRTNKDAVVVSLFGIEDAQALDRVRKETACMWIEEAAPTTEGAGVPEEACNIGITSQRIPTHAPVTMLTANYPHPGHWLWRRFKPIMGVYGLNVHPDDPRILTYQIPKGDNRWITPAQRQKWYDRLKHRPDLQARLLEGRPAVIKKGRAVAILMMKDEQGNFRNIGYDEKNHLSPTRLRPVKGYKIHIGQDGGLTPVTTIGQSIGGRVTICASLVIDGGMRQQYQHNVVPWLRRFAPWAVEDPTEYIEGVYDPSLPADESDSDRNPLKVIQEMLGGIWQPGPVKWEARKGPMMAVFQMTVPGTFEPALQLDPTDGEPLKEALEGGWFYPTDRFGEVSSDQPKKPNHPDEDCGDSFCYFLCSALPDVARLYQSQKDDPKLLHEYDPYEENRVNG